MSYSFAARRFCDRGSRPDCFEVYDKRTDACASFGCLKREALEAARSYNREWRDNPLSRPPVPNKVRHD